MHSFNTMQCTVAEVNVHQVHDCPKNDGKYELEIEWS